MLQLHTRRGVHTPARANRGGGGAAHTSDQRAADAVNLFGLVLCVCVCCCHAASLLQPWLVEEGVVAGLSGCLAHFHCCVVFVCMRICGYANSDVVRNARDRFRIARAACVAACLCVCVRVCRSHNKDRTSRTAALHCVCVCAGATRHGWWVCVCWLMLCCWCWVGKIDARLRVLFIYKISGSRSLFRADDASHGVDIVLARVRVSLCVCRSRMLPVHT